MQGMRAILDQLRGRSASAASTESGVIQGRKENVNGNGYFIQPTKVRAVMDELRLARDAYAVIIGQKETAEATLASLKAETARLQNQLAAKERELALAGGPLPESAFPEEAEIGRLVRKCRVVTAHIQAIEQKAAPARTTIGELKERVEAAWSEFATQNCFELRVRFRKAALALRDLYAQEMAWPSNFRCGPFGTPEGGSGKARSGREVVEDRLIAEVLRANCEFAGGEHNGEPRWKPLASELYEHVCALRAEVEAAKGE